MIDIITGPKPPLEARRGERQWTRIDQDPRMAADVELRNKVVNALNALERKRAAMDDAMAILKAKIVGAWVPTSVLRRYHARHSDQDSRAVPNTEEVVHGQQEEDSTATSGG